MKSIVPKLPSSVLGNIQIIEYLAKQSLLHPRADRTPDTHEREREISIFFHGYRYALQDQDTT